MYRNENNGIEMVELWMHSFFENAAVIISSFFKKNGTFRYVIHL